MSERINVDHAFDPEARQAQADFDAYLESRPASQAEADAAKDHYDESLTTGETSDESLEQLAQRVADARAVGDTTRAGDAEEAFFAKFNAYSEKYGWENEVIDESATGQLAVDKNAKIGRDTIDARLERYGKIMYGEEPLAIEAPQAVSEPAPQHETPAVSEPEAVAEQEPSADADIRVTPWEPPVMTEGDLARKQAAIERVKQEAADDEPISLDGLEPVTPEVADETPEYSSERTETPAHDGESLAEYEARHGVVDTEAIPTENLEPVSPHDDEVETVRRSWRRRMANFFTPAGFAAEMHNVAAAGKEKIRRHPKATVALGVLAVGGAIGAYYLLRDTGAAAAPAPRNGGGEGLAAKAHEVFGNGSVDVRNGDGYTQVLDRVLDQHNVHLKPNELLKLHQHLEHTQGDYINLHGGHDVFTMADGTSGLSRPDGDARMSEATQKAAIRWLQNHGKLS